MSAHNTVERLCDILEMVLLDEPATEAKIVEGTGLSRSVVSRYLKHFEEAGFVECDMSFHPKNYCVGDRLRVILGGRGKE